MNLPQLNIPNELPNSIIIKSLIDKQNQIINCELDYIHLLDEVRNKVSIEVSQINVLFPEYTPHDEKFHLKRLFKIADDLLGEELILNMNIAELFLLAVSLYAHDWGMAVSENEKKLLLSSQSYSASFDSLEEEQEIFNLFCSDRNILNKANITTDVWREYVRQTHAQRSGRRIKEFLHIYSISLANSASLISEGHWVDFNIMNDYNLYPNDASVLGMVIDLKALAVYVRLIDLLDIGEDRTPYILWKYIAPKDSISKMEWAKHRALSPVSFPNYQGQMRYILVEGNTPDVDVYSGLMDIKEYIEEQFRQCLDLLNRTNRSYHKLNISHIEWRILPKGFEPVKIRFEFDRSRMFEILGAEIYQNDPYVFIRELIQNAIDAISMREEILQQHKMSFEPSIDIDIVSDDMSYSVRISDNGIGMDEYIVKNYLSIAGKSYYRSSDFDKMGLRMDPISKFGIGILSCFMVADKIDIETYRDQHLTDQNELLKISIPSKDKFFRIEKKKCKGSPGTSVNVFVLKEKLPKIDFDVTTYIRTHASFVKYPIKIKEGNTTTTIISPLVCIDKRKIQSLIRSQYNYPIEKIMYPQSLSFIKDNFQEKKIDVRDLNIDGYEGFIIFYIPKDKDIDFIKKREANSNSSFELFNFRTGENTNCNLRTHSDWVSFKTSSYGSYTSYKLNEGNYIVYLNGILVKNIQSPKICCSNESVTGSVQKQFSPFIVLNINKKYKINISRTDIISSQSWDTPVWNGLCTLLINNEIPSIIQKESFARLLGIARLMTNYNLNTNIVLSNLIDITSFPIPFIDSEGEIVTENFDMSKHSEIRILEKSNEFLSEELEEFFRSKFINDEKSEKYQGVYSFWKGRPILVNNYSDIYSLNNISLLLNHIISKYYYLSKIEIVSSNIGTPLIVYLLKYDQNIKDYIYWEESDGSNIDNLSDKETSLLYRKLRNSIPNIPNITRFDDYYSEKAFWGWHYCNINNSKARQLVILFICISKARHKKLLAEDKMGDLFDEMNKLPFISDDTEGISIDVINNRLNKFLNKVISFGLIRRDEISDFNIDIDDFAKPSISISPEGNIFSYGHFMEKFSLHDLDNDEYNTWGMTFMK